MKKYILAINLLALIILISSCEDIVDADHKIKKTKIEYHSVRANQETGVIMPLKIGNIWIYKTTIYTNGFVGTMTSYDTITVKEETIINGEKWFVLGLTGKNSTSKDYITNTDVGLCFKTNSDLNESKLIAEYPLKHSLYYHGNQYNSAFYNDSSTIINNTLDYWTNTKIIPDWPIFYGNIAVYKYSTWTKNKQNNEKKDTIAIEYYQPNVGIVHREQYNFNQDKSVYWTTISDLVYTNLEIGQLIKQSTFEIDFGNLNEGKSKVNLVNKILENDSPTSLIINSIQIVPNQCFSIINSLEFPYVIASHDSFGLIIDFTPVSLGYFVSEMLIHTNQGTFSLQLKGLCN